MPETLHRLLFFTLPVGIENSLLHNLGEITLYDCRSRSGPAVVTEFFPLPLHKPFKITAAAAAADGGGGLTVSSGYYQRRYRFDPVPAEQHRIDNDINAFFI